ncbi:MAG: NHLP leader peptide family RiPP precursor [Nitrospirae bacterium]|nr:NHLP leader peptide family RiPP precursor [Nitrospirota bacterium]
MSEKNAKPNKMQELIKKAWKDEAFKTKLLSDTMAALKEQDIDVPVGITIKAVENTATHITLIIPSKPEPSELSEADMSKIAGGGCSNTKDCGESLSCWSKGVTW